MKDSRHGTSITAEQILLTSIIAVLVSGIVGVIGMLGAYSSFPTLILAEPTCECPTIHEDYDRLRNLFGIVGFLFGLIPIGLWQLYTRSKLKADEQKVNKVNDSS